MLKKLKDLSYDEMVDVCARQKSCENCPFSLGDLCLGNKKIIERLNVEIEVNENGF